MIENKQQTEIEPPVPLQNEPKVVEDNNERCLSPHDGLLGKIKKKFDFCRYWLDQIWPRRSNLIQAFILATLIANLLYYFSEYRENKQRNQPLVAIKESEVTKLQDDIIKISATFMNFGNTVAKDVLIEWTFFAVERDEEQKPVTITQFGQTNKIPGLVFLPHHENRMILIYIKLAKFHEMVNGYKRNMELKAKLQYKDDEETQVFTCTYVITRLLLNDSGIYEVSLRNSHLEKIQ
ncbi:MAG: hypothetical protein A2X86_22505 [Bdellovibrionales bacterium GWA2_49_15]|nr:MAG: hypothetical protein A2X86_22505 [Bdellovibrionales bacterium GWA2_49_15]HAZ11543.1 hypothetical protein [Bdellovibrionales bacterium]